MERLLVVANNFPYPPDHGAALDIWWRIQALKKLGFALDLAATVNSEKYPDHLDAVRSEVEELFFIPRSRAWTAALSWKPFQVRSRRGLRSVSLSRDYAAVILEAEHVAAILENPQLRARKRILRVHNNEANYFRELGESSKSLRRALFYYSEAAKFRLFQEHVAARCDALWFISDSEMKDYFKKHAPDSRKCFYVPPALDNSTMTRQKLEGRKTLFIGTLELPNNAGAVEWFVTNVHPLLSQDPDYSLLVAGRTTGAENSNLKKVLGSHSNITYHKNPANLQDVYAEAAVFVNPVLRGAGLKMKTIDAIRAGVPVVTTSAGVEGSRLVHEKHLLVADSTQSFAECTSRLFKDKNLAQALVSTAQEFIAAEYDPKAVMRRALSSVFCCEK